MSKTVCPIPRVANEGNITITAVKDGIHGNDRITINGGKIYTKSTGGSNSIPMESSVAQYAVVLAGTSVNSIVHIEGEHGEVLTFKLEIAYESMIFSSPLLEAGKTYSIYTGGTTSGGSNFYGIYSDSIYSGGTKGEEFTTSSIVTIQGAKEGMGGGGNHPQGGEKLPPNEKMQVERP